MTSNTTVVTLDALSDFAQSLLDSIPEVPSATIFYLGGDLGVGKTTFVTALAGVLDIGEVITSPTFVIQKSYPIAQHSRFSQLIHIDAYRLDSGDDLEKLRSHEYFADPSNLICIEWYTNITSALPGAGVYIDIAIVDAATRSFTVSVV